MRNSDRFLDVKYILLQAAVLLVLLMPCLPNTFLSFLLLFIAIRIYDGRELHCTRTFSISVGSTM